MKTMWIVMLAVVIMLSAGIAFGQTTPPSNAGAFDQLSPGNQKIARALFEGQPESAKKPLSLDDIAARKLNGNGGWGQVFKGMNAEGLTQDKNLGQAVSRFNHESKGSSQGTLITTGSGKTFKVGGGTEAGRDGAVSKSFGDNGGKGNHGDGGAGARASVSHGGSDVAGRGGGGGGVGGNHGGGRGKWPRADCPRVRSAGGGGPGAAD